MFTFVPLDLKRRFQNFQNIPQSPEHPKGGLVRGGSNLGVLFSRDCKTTIIMMTVIVIIVIIVIVVIVIIIIINIDIDININVFICIFIISIRCPIGDPPLYTRLNF